MGLPDISRYVAPSNSGAVIPGKVITRPCFRLLGNPGSIAVPLRTSHKSQPADVIQGERVEVGRGAGRLLGPRFTAVRGANDRSTLPARPSVRRVYEQDVVQRFDGWGPPIRGIGSS